MHNSIIPKTTNLQEAVGHLRETGCVVWPQLISEKRLLDATAVAEDLLEPTPVLMPGRARKVRGRMCKQLLAKSRAFDDILSHPDLIDVVASYLSPSKPTSDRIRLAGTMIKDVQPFETGRAFHRDTVLYPDESPQPPIVVNTLLALDRFRVETGATRIVPGTHLWPEVSDQNPDFESVEMDAGDILIFDGAIWHTNGNNTTRGSCRKALNMYYVVSRLKSPEGNRLGLNEETVAALEPSLRRLVC